MGINTLLCCVYVPLVLSTIAYVPFLSLLLLFVCVKKRYRMYYDTKKSAVRYHTIPLGNWDTISLLLDGISFWNHRIPT